MATFELTLHPKHDQRLSLDRLATETNCHEELVRQLLGYGLLESIGTEESIVWFDVAAVPRIRRIQRLRHDLGINLPGIGAVLQLLERIQRLQREVAELKRRPSPRDAPPSGGTRAQSTDLHNPLHTRPKQNA